MPRHYVDNAMNRSLGRVGMPHGSAVHSTSSSSSGRVSSTSTSSSARVSSSSGSSGFYVDNSMNRSLGRVGMAHGTAVHSTSSSSSGRVSSSSGSSGVYVDNAMNRSLGRVGMAHGTAVHSRSDSSSSSSQSGVYVDNAMNRSLGRVGLPHGSAVHSKSSQSSYSSPSTYVDNELNRRLGRVGLEKGTAVHSKSETIKNSPKTYVDNPYNRKLGRVGLPFGLAATSSSSARVSKVGNAAPRTYVDNALNRRLGRVGKPLGSCPVSKVKCDPIAFDFNNDRFCEEAEIYKNYSYADYICEEIENLIHLKQAKRDSLINKNNKIELKSEQIIPFEELELGDKIGGGGFGDIHIAFWKNQQVAVKKLRVQRVHQSKKKQFEDEVRSICALDHPNIVKFYGACIVTPNLALVMELLPDGSLYDNLYYSELQFEEKTKNQFICDFFSALEYIHSKNMVHRDLKSKNILLCDEKSHCKLADFGLALKDETESNSSTKQFGFAGTEKYCPKEVLEGNRLTIEELKLVDVYALALTTFELLTEKEPFDDCRNIHEIRRAIMDGKILHTLTNEDYGISAAKKDLLKAALSHNRPSAAEFLRRFKQTILTGY